MTHLREHPDESLGALAHRLTEQVPALVRSEIKLAQAELAEKGRHAGLGAGLAGVGGLLAVLGLGSLTAAAVMALALVMPGWASALIVGVALLVIAGIVALAGRAQVRRAVPARPELAVEGMREDLSIVKGGRS